MLEMTANPGKFAARFNEKYPGAYRQIIELEGENCSAVGLYGSG